MQTLSQSEPKARKAHKCQMCYRTIEPGETYTRQANLGDDGFYSWVNCQQCDVFLNLDIADRWDGGQLCE